MIITVEKVKLINGISGTAYDSQLAEIIPLAGQKAIDFTMNSFHLPWQFVQEYTISFSAADKKIINGSGNFISESYGTIIRFQAGLSIHVENSILNDGFFNIASVSAGELVVSNDDILFDEAAGSLIKISLVKFSKGFELSLAKYINYLLAAKNPEYQSESIGDYSYTRASEAELLSNFFKGYMRIGVV